MKKDEYSFLELFGNIDDEYIVQALQPWKRQTRRYMVYHIGRKAVCLAFIVMLGLCLAFHDQVHAAVSRFTTMIAEILQISNDHTTAQVIYRMASQLHINFVRQNKKNIFLESIILPWISIRLKIENTIQGCLLTTQSPKSSKA